MDRHVKVWDHLCRVEVAQQAATVWVASGVYLGRPIEARARNATAAIRLWREAAQAAGDGEPVQPRLEAAILILATRGRGPEGAAAFERAAREAFRRAAIARVPEQRRRLAHALRTLSEEVPAEAQAEILDVIKSFNDRAAAGGGS